MSNGRHWTPGMAGKTWEEGKNTTDVVTDREAFLANLRKSYQDARPPRIIPGQATQQDQQVEKTK